MEQYQWYGSKALFQYVTLVVLGFILAACGGGGGGGTAPPVTPTATAPANVNLTVAPGQLQFSWDAATLADHYRILVNPDGASGFSVVPTAANISGTAHVIDIPVLNTDWQAARYLVEACDAAETNCLASTEQTLSPVDSVAATLYLKASNTDSDDNFGYAVA